MLLIIHVDTITNPFSASLDEANALSSLLNKYFCIPKTHLLAYSSQSMAQQSKLNSPISSQFAALCNISKTEMLENLYVCRLTNLAKLKLSKN